MKILLLILLALPIASLCQTSTNKPLPDSVIKEQQYTDSVVQVVITKTPVMELQQFLYKQMSAEAYDAFVKAYQAFIQQKFYELTKNRKK